MKMLLKKGSILFGACVIFLLGYRYRDRSDYQEKQEQVAAIREEISERNLSWETRKPEKKDEEFLQEHVFGAWSFSKRIIALEENDSVNFTSQGIEKMQNIWIRYDRDSVRRYGYDERDGTPFSTVEDIYLFAEYGGDKTVWDPVYHIEWEVDEERINLRNILGKEIYIQFPQKYELVHVYYDLAYDIENNSSVCGYYYADDIYVNPDDKDTLYLNFCGLWELKREEDGFKVGKSPTGKG